MFKVKNVLIALVVLVGAAYGGVKAYIYFEAKEKVDQLAQSAALFADVKYGGIASRLTGSVIIEDVRITPRQVDEPIQIDALEIEFPGVEYLLSSKNAMEQGRLPEKLKISLRGLRLDANGQLAQMMYRASVRAGAGSSPLTCGPGMGVHPRVFQGMGYDVFVGDLDLGYDFTTGNGGVRLFANIIERGMETTRLQASLVGPTPNLGKLMMRPEVLLTDFSVTHDIDQDYGERLTRGCAKMLGMTHEQYVQAVASASDAEFARTQGFIPGPGIRQALSRLYRDPRGFEVSAHPSTPVDVTTLSTYRPEDLDRLLGLKITVNGKPVSDTTFALAPRAPGGAQSGASAGQGSQGRGGADDEPPVSVAKYRSVNITELRGHVGQNVRLRTADGKRHTGRLGGVRNGQLALERHVHGGTITIQIGLNDVRQAEVWLYGEP